MKVSILIPVYGVEKYIEKCARSLFGQTFRDIEYIFVNDGTPDRSIEILHAVLEEYPERADQVRIIDHERNKGLAAARNTAVAHAGGEYVMHVDSDDYIDPETVETMYGAATTEDADMVVCDFLWQFETYATYAPNYVPQNKSEYVEALIARKTQVNIWGKLIRKSLYTDNHIEIPEKFSYGEDYRISPCLAFFSGKIIHIPKAFFHYVQYNAYSYINSVSDLQITRLQEIVNGLEDFFQNCQVYTKYSDAFETAKLKIKFTGLFCLPDPTRRKYAGIYSGTDLRAHRNDLSRTERIVLNLADKRAFGVLNGFISVYGFLGKIKRKIRRAYGISLRHESR